MSTGGCDRAHSKALGSSHPRKTSERGIGRRVMTGLAWTLAQSAIARIVSLASQLALAALLAPADFGRIGLATTVTSVAWTLMSVGIDDVLMRRRDALRLWTGHAFWINMSLSCFAGLVVAAAAPLAARAYGAPDIVGLLQVAALSMPLSALSSVQALVVRARMDFGFIAAYGTCEAIVGAILTIGFAYAGFGAYSFVLPPPILAAIKAVVWWRLAPVRIALRPRPSRWRHLADGTLYSFAARLLHAAVGQGDYFILGLVASQQLVGVYYFGFRLAIQPLALIVANLTNVLYPALTHFRAEPQRQGEAAFAAVKLLLYCMMPAGIMQAALAEPLVHVVFAAKWWPSIPIIQILSVALAVDSAAWVAEALMNARGEFRSSCLYAAAETPLFFGLVYAGASTGHAIGVACGVCAFYLSKPLFIVFVFRKIGLTTGQIAKAYLQPICFAALSIGPGWLLSKIPFFENRPLFQIMIILIVGSTSHAIGLKSCAPDAWGEVERRILFPLRSKISSLISRRSRSTLN